MILFPLIELFITNILLFGLQSLILISVKVYSSTIQADNGSLLLSRRIALYKQFKNLGDCSKLPLSRLRFYAKRLGVSMAGKMRKQRLITALRSFETTFTSWKVLSQRGCKNSVLFRYSTTSFCLYMPMHNINISNAKPRNVYPLFHDRILVFQNIHYLLWLQPTYLCLWFFYYPFILRRKHIFSLRFWIHLFC